MTSLYEAAWALSIGQSVGNPNIRNKWETDELFKNQTVESVFTNFYLKNIHPLINYIPILSSTNNVIIQNLIVLHSLILSFHSSCIL